MSRHPEGRAQNPCGQDWGLQTALVGSDPHPTWGEREGGPLEGGEGCLAWEGGVCWDMGWVWTQLGAGVRAQTPGLQPCPLVPSLPACVRRTLSLGCGAMASGRQYLLCTRAPRATPGCPFASAAASA